MAVKIYDANEVSIEYATRTFDSGYDDGVFCRIKQEAADFGAKQGTDGQVTRYKTNQSMSSVSLILMQSSDGMNILSSLRNIDLLGTNGAGVSALLIRDRNGLSVFAAPESWITGPPEVAYGREPEAREWILAAANPTRFDGGN